MLVATDERIVKAWAIRRLPAEEQWDGERVRRIKGSPKNWAMDMGEDSHDVDLEEENDDQEEVEFLPPETRRGEKKSMYLSRKDFDRHGHTDGCVGCRVIASGKKGRTGVAHTRACRRRRCRG